MTQPSQPIAPRDELCTLLERARPWISQAVHTTPARDGFTPRQREIMVRVLGDIDAALGRLS